MAYATRLTYFAFHFLFFSFNLNKTKPQFCKQVMLSGAEVARWAAPVQHEFVFSTAGIHLLNKNTVCSVPWLQNVNTVTNQ